MMEPFETKVDEGTYLRLDTYLAQCLPSVSRTRIKSWCKEGRVLVDGNIRKGSFMLHGAEDLVVDMPELEHAEHIQPEDLPLEIVHEDEAIIVINKQAGMVVHPGAGIHRGTLVNALVFHFGQLAELAGAMRPGIVHRLDKGTSGLILVAKTDEAHRHLTDQWQSGSVTKVYQALVWGTPDPSEGEIETHIGRHAKYRHRMAVVTEGGKWAKSRYKVTEAYPEACRVNVHILTGRTHQIRVHLAHLDHPVVGDVLYGRNRHRNLTQHFPAMPDRPMLHAALLRFRHPLSLEVLTFKQKPPEDFLSCADVLSRWP